MAQMKYFYELTVASSPHAHGKFSTRRIMLDVVLALCLPLLGAIYFFGLRALTVTAVSVAACVFFEWGYRKMMKQDTTIGDLSAVVTGMLIAFVCPVRIPYWTIVVGDFFATVLVKQLFGGIGKNFMNPALAARAFLFSWPVIMTTWQPVGLQNAAAVFAPADVVSAATPLAAMHGGALPEASLGDLFLGNISGSLGETSAMLILLGGLYLICRKVIHPRIPCVFLGTVALITLLFPQGNPRGLWMASQLFSGGLMLGAVFMATDYVTSPVTKWGQVIYAAGCGVLTVVIRYFGSYVEGVSYAILVMNACAPLLDKVGRPRKFGTPKKQRGAAK